MKVICKRRVTHFTKMMTDTSKSKVHFCKSICSSLFFLSINIDACYISLFGFNEFCRLNKHTTRTTRWIIKSSIIGFNHRCNKLNNIMRRIELSFLFSSINSKFFKEVFIHMTDEVFFLTKSFMTNFIDFIDQLFNIVSTKIS